MAPKKTKTQEKNTNDETNLNDQRFILLKDVSTNVLLIVNSKSISPNQIGKMNVRKEVTYTSTDRMRGRGIVLGIGSEEECNDLLKVLDNNNSSKNNDSTEAALTIDTNQKDSNDESDDEVPMVVQKDNIAVAKQVNSIDTASSKSSAQNKKRPLSITNKSSDNDENLSPRKRLKSDSDEETFAYLRSRMTALMEENKKLKNEIEEVRSTWMPRPDPVTIGYFAQIVQICAGGNDDNDAKADKLEKIMTVLAISEGELETCLDRKSIRNTCGKIVRIVFKEQIKDPQISFKTILKKHKNQVKIIRDYGRLMLPIEGSQYTDGELNNAMGSDFYQRDRNLRQTTNHDNKDEDEDGN